MRSILLFFIISSVIITACSRSQGDEACIQNDTDIVSGVEQVPVLTTERQDLRFERVPEEVQILPMFEDTVHMEVVFISPSVVVLNIVNNSEYSFYVYDEIFYPHTIYISDSSVKLDFFTGEYWVAMLHSGYFLQHLPIIGIYGTRQRFVAPGESIMLDHVLLSYPFLHSLDMELRIRKYIFLAQPHRTDLWMEIFELSQEDSRINPFDFSMRHTLIAYYNWESSERGRFADGSEPMSLVDYYNYFIRDWQDDE